MSARCLDVRFWISTASNWSLIPGIAQSKNRQLTVRRLVRHGHREHCNWSIGPSHPWLPFASTTSTVDITTLATLPRVTFPPFPPLPNPYPPFHAQAAISAYNLGPEFSRATASSFPPPSLATPPPRSRNPLCATNRHRFPIGHVLLRGTLRPETEPFPVFYPRTGQAWYHSWSRICRDFSINLLRNKLSADVKRPSPRTSVSRVQRCRISL